MFLISSYSCICAIYWSQVFSREWRCSWSSADRRCSNYIWVINNCIAYKGATYIRGFTVCNILICCRLTILIITYEWCNSQISWWRHGMGTRSVSLAICTGNQLIHYSDVIMTTMAVQITSLPVVYSIVYSGADQRKHQSSASLAFVWGIHRDRWIPRTKCQLRGKCFHLMTSSWWSEMWCFDVPVLLAPTNKSIRVSQSGQLVCCSPACSSWCQRKYQRSAFLSLFYGSPLGVEG